MSALAAGLGTLALASAGGFLLFGPRALAARLLAIALLLLAGSAVLRVEDSSLSPEGFFVGTIVSMAVGGACVHILGASWGLWLALPAGLAFVGWPLVQALAPAMPFWMRAAAVVALPAVLSLLGLRAARQVLKGVLGDDAAARSVAHGIARLIGAPGKSQARQVRWPGYRAPPDFLPPQLPTRGDRGPPR